MGLTRTCLHANLRPSALGRSWRSLTPSSCVTRHRSGVRVCGAEQNEVCDVMIKHKLIHPSPCSFFRVEQPAPNLLCLVPSMAVGERCCCSESDVVLVAKGPNCLYVSIVVFLISSFQFDQREKLLARNRL